MSAAAQPYPHVSDGSSITEVKDEFRAAIRAARRARSPRLRAAAADAFVDVVETIPALADAGVVAAYSARPTEPDTGPLLDALAARGARVLLPVLGAGLQREWAWFAGRHDLLERAPGRPPEPSGPSLGADAIAEVDVIVAPALAVDTAGNRLGQGGGWYDRALAHARPGTPIIALVFAEELYDAATRPLPHEPHDRTVDIVATPERWVRLGG